MSTKKKILQRKKIPILVCSGFSSGTWGKVCGVSDLCLGAGEALGWGVALRGGVDEADRVEGAGHGWVGVCPTLRVAGRVRGEWGGLRRAGAPPAAGDTAAGRQP